MKAAVLSQEEAQTKDANRRDAGARITSHSVPWVLTRHRGACGMVRGFGDPVLTQSVGGGACEEFHSGACMQPESYILTSPVTT